MILSVSRRTDIPNYYSDWFINRIREGYLYVRNPMNANQISKIDLSPEVVDCIVFWTKNPADMIDKLDELKDYQYYFQITLTGYGKDVEPGLPDKNEVLIPAFKRLSAKIGKKRTIWRYDPILINSKYSKDYHYRAFAKIADELKDYTERVVISFVDLYAKTQRNTAGLQIENTDSDEMVEIAARLAEIAHERGLEIESCAEAIDLESVGVAHGHCIDKKLIEEIIGCPIRVNKDKNQRPECGCMESVEVGSYNTCKNGCKYCYANFNPERVISQSHLYDPNSPILCGIVDENAGDKITVRKVESLKDNQISLFDI